MQLARHEVRVNEGKGAKDRVLWIDAGTSAYLEAWLDRRRDLARRWDGKRQWFFTTLTGDRLDNSYVRHMVARYGRKAGIEIACHPHLLRHTYASELLEDGYTLPEVQKLLGHERLETTAIYQHVSDERLRLRLVDRPG